MNKQDTITNKHGEEIDFILGSNLEAPEVIIFVHGFGVDMHETGKLFDYEAEALSHDYLTLQFSLSGCGKSGGRSEDMDYHKHADDLNAVITFVKDHFPDKAINLITHSMGGFVTAVLSSEKMHRVIMVGLPNYNTRMLEKRLIGRFAARQGAVVDTDGVSVFPRSTGLNQLIGASFWDVLRGIQPIELVATLSTKTQLKLIHMNQDEILGDEYIDEYHHLRGIEAVYIEGDHSVTKAPAREALMKEIYTFLNKE